MGFPEGKDGEFHGIRTDRPERDGNENWHFAFFIWEIGGA